MPNYYVDYDCPDSHAAYENAIANTTILHTSSPVFTTTETEDAQSTITAFEEVYHVKEGEVPQLLRHGRDVHPAWVKSSIETLSNTRSRVLSARAKSEEGFDSY